VASYSVQLAPSAKRDLAALDKPVQRRVAARIDALAENPRPAGVTKLRGEANAWRIRVGDPRILYTIEDRRLVVLVIRSATGGRCTGEGPWCRQPGTLLPSGEVLVTGEHDGTNARASAELFQQRRRANFQHPLSEPRALG
jgi:mRNA interferase RelE/StbE